MVIKPNFTGHRKDIPTLRDYWVIWKLMSVYPRKIMELGIDAGGSLLLWNDMFAPDVIVGLDINTLREGLRRLDEFPNIQIHCFDQNNMDTLRDVLNILGDIKFDLIIDDCTHTIDGAMNSLYILWPYLNPGGAYVIEDWNQDEVYAKDMTCRCLDRLGCWPNVSFVTVTSSLIGLVKCG